MTGFIANTTTGVWGSDFIVDGAWSPEKQQAALAEWNKGLGKDYDADKVIRAFKDAGATGVIFYDKWHDGLVAHDTALTQFKTERDLVGPTLTALRKHGLNKVVYYSVGLDSNPEPRFREWANRTPDGHPMGLAFPTDWMSFHSPYREYVIDHLTEIVKMHGPVDGLWLDLYTQPRPSYLASRGKRGRHSHDRRTMQAYQRAAGQPIEKASDEEIQDFVMDDMRAFLLEIRRGVDKVQPGVSLTFNGAGMHDVVEPAMAAKVDSTVDFFSMEGHRWETIDRGARLGHAMDRPFEVGMLLSASWYVPMSDEAPPASMSEAEAVVSAATAWIHGANVYGAMTPGHSGVYDDDGDMRLLRAAGKWLKDNKPLLVASNPYADIGVLTGNPSVELHHNPTLDRLWRASHFRGVEVSPPPGFDTANVIWRYGYLTERVGSSFAGREFDLNDYRMLLIPETALLDETQVKGIREYVRSGGLALAFGHSSLIAPNGEQRDNFALSDVFGVDYVGTLPGYKHLNVKSGSGVSSSLGVNPGALRVKTTTATVLATWKGVGDVPAIVENQFGKGRAIYSSGEEIAFSQSGPMLNELISRLIGQPVVSIDAGRDYVVLMNRKNDDLVLYLINRSTGSRSAANPGIWVQQAQEAGPVTTPEHIAVNLDSSVLGKISGAKLIPSGKLSLSQRAGSIRLSLDASPAVTTVHLKR